MTLDSDRAIIYNMQDIKDQLTASEFRKALSGFEITCTYRDRMGDLKAIELKVGDDRFSKSKCWEAQLSGKTITFAPCADPYAKR